MPGRSLSGQRYFVIINFKWTGLFHVFPNYILPPGVPLSVPYIRTEVAFPIKHWFHSLTVLSSTTPGNYGWLPAWPIDDRLICSNKGALTANKSPQGSDKYLPCIGSWWERLPRQLSRWNKDSKGNAGQYLYASLRRTKAQFTPADPNRKPPGL